MITALSGHKIPLFFEIKIAHVHGEFQLQRVLYFEYKVFLEFRSLMN